MNYYIETVNNIKAVKERLLKEELTQLEIDSAQSDLDTVLSCLEELASVHEISTEYIRNVVCPKCDNWEEMPADMPRHKMQTFTWIENTEQEAKYKCSCGEIVESTTE